MYKTIKGSLGHNAEPWRRPIRNRVRDLDNISYDKLIVYFYNKDYDNSSFRYRCYNMCETINMGTNNHGLISLWFTQNESEYLLSIIDKVDILIICRSTMDSLVAHVVSLARAHRVKIIFDVDDLVIEPKLIPLIVETVTTVPRDLDSEEALWIHWYAYISRLRATMNECDLSFVPTKPLAHFISNKIGFHTEVIPNFMDKAQIAHSNELFEFKSSRNFERDDKFTLGYFSGSPSHNKDFALASSALVGFMKNHDEVELIVGGYINTELFAHNNLMMRVRKLPYTDHLELQSNISSVEINLAPLQQNQFTYCKSVLKYFDAAAVGVPTIASPTPNMESAIRNGFNGYISADNDWLEILERLFIAFPKIGEDLSLNAHKDSQINYSGVAHESEIIQLLMRL